MVDKFDKKLPSLFIASLLFIGGIILLSLKITGWSLFLGLPATQIGLVLLIFSFDSFGRKKETEGDYHLIPCLLCHRQTLTPKYIDKKICESCQVKIAQRVKVAFLALYVLAIIPLSLSLVGKRQEIRMKAKEIAPVPTKGGPTPATCETGFWEPDSCRCGEWNENINCPEEKEGRTCDFNEYCCQFNEDHRWDCQPL